MPYNPGRPYILGDIIPGEWQINPIYLSVVTTHSQLGLLCFHNLQQIFPKGGCIIGRQSKDGGKDSCLMLATLMLGIEDVIKQFANVNDRVLGIWNNHALNYTTSTLHISLNPRWLPSIIWLTIKDSCGEDLLETLVALGQAQAVGGGRYGVV